MSNEPQPAAELQGVGVLAGGRWILDGVTLRLPPGVCCAAIGPNGCGKSTLARVLSGFVWPTRGRVCVLGESFGEIDLHDLRKRVKLVQATNLVEFEPDLSAMDVVLTGAFGTILLFDPPSAGDRERAAELMGRLGVSHLAGAAFGRLSTGERMRVLIARALIKPPALLLLDEPTAGLDLVGRELLLDGLDQVMAHLSPRPTILMISHHVEELPAATDWALVMKQGRVLADGPVDSVIADGPMSEAFGASVNIQRRGGRFAARIDRPPGRPVFD